MDGEVETILRLVSEGALSAEDAERLLDALGRAEGKDDPPGVPTPSAPTDPLAMAQAAAERAREAASRGRDRLETARAEMRSTDPAQRYLRIEVTEGDRRVVNLRVPLGIAGAAAALVPGLGSIHAERIREAIRSGVVGPIIDVQDGHERVVISAE